MTIESSKDVVRRFIDGSWNYERLMALPELVTSDYVFHDAIGDIRGITAFREELAEELEAFADVLVTVDEIIGEGDLIAVRYTTSYVHHGEFMHAYPTGKLTTLHGMSMHRVVDGKVAETWEAYDRRTLARDIGAEQRLSDADEAAILDAVEKALKIGFADRLALAEHYWAETAEVVAANGQRMRGRRAVLDWLQRFPPVTDWKLFDLIVDGAGELACVRGTYQMTLSGRSRAFDKGYYLDVWRKQFDGSWKVMHTVYTSELARARRAPPLAQAERTV